jgi:hypothetical protein
MELLPPYAMNKEEWNTKMAEAKRKLAGNYVQEKAVRSSASSMVNVAAEIDFLSFGVRDHLKSKLGAVQSGDLVLSEFGRKRFIIELDRPISYGQVRLKARKQGLI